MFKKKKKKEYKEGYIDGFIDGTGETWLEISDIACRRVLKIMVNKVKKRKLKL